MTHHPKKILVLFWYSGRLEEIRAAIGHHLRALESSETRHKLFYYNAVNGAPAWLRYMRFDAVILHTTFLQARWSTWFYNRKWNLRWIHDLRCAKIALPQDEYDHSEILDEWLYELDVSSIFTCHDASTRQLLYPLMHSKARFYECLTGYVDERIARQYEKEILSPETRRYDVVYRAKHLPYWFGSHGQMKHKIAGVVEERAQALGLSCDISTDDKNTIVGNRWFDFLASGRVVIGCETGSSVIDRRGELKAKIESLLRANPQLSFAQVSAQLPAGWDNYQLFAVGPRHFEAVITKTCQVLVEGHYNGIFQPDRHYIPLKQDYSNLDEVLLKIRDYRYIEQIAEQAYKDIYLSRKYTYQHLAWDIEKAIDDYSSQ